MVPDEEAQITVQMLKSLPGPGVDNVVALVAILNLSWDAVVCGAFSS
jgi:hypothetical protein